MREIQEHPISVLDLDHKRTLNEFIGYFSERNGFLNCLLRF